MTDHKVIPADLANWIAGVDISAIEAFCWCIVKEEAAAAWRAWVDALAG